MKEERIGAVFSALGDPTRRQVMECLASEGAMTATELASQIPVTRQAIAKHLSTLSEAVTLPCTSPRLIASFTLAEP